MSDHPHLDKLLLEAKRLVSLLEEPELGLATWHMMVGDVLREIAEYAPQKDRK
jgi:hypothetical protein